MARSFRYWRMILQGILRRGRHLHSGVASRCVSVAKVARKANSARQAPWIRAESAPWAGRARYCNARAIDGHVLVCIHADWAKLWHSRSIR